MKEKSEQQENQLKNRLISKGLLIVLVMIVMSLRAYPPLLEVLIKIFYWALPLILILAIYKFFTNKLNEGFSSSIKRRNSNHSN